MFLCDEYQSFASVGEDDPSGDEKAFALTRQSRVIPIVATQSISSLKSVLSGQDAWRTLLQTLRTKVFLSLSDDSSRTHYAVTEPVLRAIRRFGTDGREAAVRRFRREQGALVERYARDRKRRLVPVRLPDGQVVRLSPGRHNQVQKAIVEEFAPRFAPGALLLYLGDTEKKALVVDSARCAELGIPLTDHDKLPDVVLYDAKREWIFLVEAVSSQGPVSPSRRIDLEDMLAGCDGGVVYVSAFPDFAEFRKHMSNIAWETEVWLCDAPEHLIHYDGERFLGPAPR